MHLGKEQSTGTATDNEDLATGELPEAAGSPQRRDAAGSPERREAPATAEQPSTATAR
ncbi:MAG TPA: hypothetical protein VMU14_18060 [Acidimicrobiales bacterium]|nr:hypothetical protein [Acidimicrobiales bacterium]